MNNLSIISLSFGFIGCLFVILSFCFQLFKIYKSKNASGTSWGLIYSQIITSISFAISSSINIYLDGIVNLPFLAANVILLLLFFVMAFMKYNYDNNISEIR